MKKTSFITYFVHLVNGDNAEALASKTLKQATSAIKSHLASWEGDTLDLEAAVEHAEEVAQNALVNNGTAITDRADYIIALIKAEQELRDAKENLKYHKEKIAFLNAKLAEISA